MINRVVTEEREVHADSCDPCGAQDHVDRGLSQRSARSMLTALLLPVAQQLPGFFESFSSSSLLDCQGDIAHGIRPRGLWMKFETPSRRAFLRFLAASPLLTMQLPDDFVIS